MEIFCFREYLFKEIFILENIYFINFLVKKIILGNFIFRKYFFQNFFRISLCFRKSWIAVAVRHMPWLPIIEAPKYYWQNGQIFEFGRGLKFGFVRIEFACTWKDGISRGVYVDFVYNFCQLTLYRLNSFFVVFRDIT